MANRRLVPIVRLDITSHRARIIDTLVVPARPLASGRASLALSCGRAVIVLSCALALLAWPSAGYAAGQTAPGSPQGLQVTSATFDSVSLAWGSSGDPVAYYQVLRDGQWVDSSYGLTATVRYLAAGTSYAFEVRARDSQGNVSPSVRLTAATRIDTGPPTAPPNLRLVTNGAGWPTGLAWDASTDDRGVGIYLLYADGGNVFWGGREVSFLSLVEEFCTVAPGQSYTFTVRAVDLSGKFSDAGTPVTVYVP